MNYSRLLLGAIVASVIATPAVCADVTAGSLKISAPWARATPKGAHIGGGYMTITNTGSTPDRLVGGSTGVAAAFELHEMSMSNGVMKMRPLTNGLEIKPGETVTLKPGSYHVMLTGLKQQLTPGEHFQATLQFEKAGKVDVDYIVGSIGAQGPDGATDGVKGDMKGDMPGMKQ